MYKIGSMLAKNCANKKNILLRRPDCAAMVAAMHDENYRGREMSDSILTSELITVEACANIWEKYRANWSRNGLHQRPASHYSESGEDGILEKIFETIGATNKYFVEFGAWDGLHLSNTAHFRLNCGWKGLLLDGKFDDEQINLHKHYLTQENIVEIFKKYDVPHVFDFLSIDIDGNDYYLLRQIVSTFKPRVIVVETNQLISPEKGCAVEYNPNIYWSVMDRYFGASVRAFDDLLTSHGYSMVCMHDQNAFFVLNEYAGQFTSIVDGVGDIHKLFKSRVPRWYLDQDGKEVEFEKHYVHQLAFKGESPSNVGSPVIARTMKDFVADGKWVLLPKEY